MLVAGLAVIAFVGLILFLFIGHADRMPRLFLKAVGHFLLFVSVLESILIVWILVYVWNSDWSLWTLSFNEFWRQQLAPVYFVKEWLYSWFWNDLLDLLFEFLPAIVFLVVRTTLTTWLGVWSLAIARRRVRADFVDAAAGQSR